MQNGKILVTKEIFEDGKLKKIDQCVTKPHHQIEHGLS